MQTTKLLKVTPQAPQGAPQTPKPFIPLGLPLGTTLRPWFEGHARTIRLPAVAGPPVTTGRSATQRVSMTGGENQWKKKNETYPEVH